MARRIKKKTVDRELLQAIFTVEKEWRQIREIGSRSIERSFESRAAENLARAKYLFLLREARRRNVNALHM